jgi:hypothetical protein
MLAPLTGFLDEQPIIDAGAANDSNAAANTAVPAERLLTD